MELTMYMVGLLYLGAGRTSELVLHHKIGVFDNQLFSPLIIFTFKKKNKKSISKHSYFLYHINNFFFFLTF
jgi:hypothetical protein